MTLITNTSHKKVVINTPIITAVRDYQPSFVGYSTDSISAHLSSNKDHANHSGVNVNTSVFSHSAQNSSSHVLKELFGIKQGEDLVESHDGDDESVHSGSHGSGAGNHIPQRLH